MTDTEAPQPGEAENTEVEPPEVTAPPVEVREEDVPTSFMQYDFSDLPAAQRQVVLDALKSQESYIGKLQQRLAERKAEPEAEPVAQFAGEPYVPEPSDDEIAAAFGLDPNGAYYEVAKEIVLPVAKQNLLLMGQVEQMNQQLQVEQAWDSWNSSLDNLEESYGELPVDRDTVIEFAIEQGIDNPEVAYYRLAMGAQKVLQEAAVEQRRKAQETARQGKREMTGVRPTGTVPPTGQAPVRTGNLAEDIKAAAAAAEKELGISWDTAAQTFLNR